MRAAFRAAAAALLASAAAQTCDCPAPPSSAPVPGSWRVVFEDDFSGAALNASAWTVSNFSQVISQYDGHDALFVADRVRVGGGMLAIDTVLETTVFDGVQYNFTSAWVDSQHKVNMTKGRFEASIKMPPRAATGAWPAFWLLPEGECWPVGGEIDVVEMWMGEGHEQRGDPKNPPSMASTYHYGYGCIEDASSYPTNSRWFPDLANKTAPVIDFSAEFHVFGVEINETALRFFVDDADAFVYPLAPLCITADNYAEHAPYMPFGAFYAILDVAVTANADTTWWRTNGMATTYIDWVRFSEFVPAAPAPQAVRAALPAPPRAPAAGTWKLTFEENFDGNALNASRWTISNWSQVISQYDGHDALFVADRVRVAGGALQIDTVLETTVFDGVVYNMSSGWIDSMQKVNQTKGRFEASIKMPPRAATGAWPAWWLLPEGLCWPISGEIDIVEWYGGPGNNQHSRVENPTVAWSTYHFGYACSADAYSFSKDSSAYPSRNWSPNFPIIDYSEAFHTFGVEVNDTALRFYVDNTTSFELALPPLCVTAATFHNHTPYMPWRPLYGILNVAVTPNANRSWWTANNATTLFDWVRWYEFVPDEGAGAAAALAPEGTDAAAELARLDALEAAP